MAMGVVFERRDYRRGKRGRVEFRALPSLDLSMTSRTGGEILVASLLAQGATHAFGVPGESYLPVLDALHDVARSPELRRLPPRRRRSVHGRSVRQAHRAARGSAW